METTLCYIISGANHVLLCEKKRGFGKGMWNGPGGKVEPGERPMEAAIRETIEETGLTPVEPECLGFIRFVWPTKPDNNQTCHIFITRKWEGKLKGETEESIQEWWPVNDLPYQSMWPDDAWWLDKVLKGRHDDCRITFNEAGDVEKIEPL